MRNKYFVVFVGILFSISYCYSQQLGTVRNRSIIISKDVDLNGTTKYLPKDYILEFKGGIIKNGTLIGNQTKIKCTGKGFDRVNIRGTWNVPIISTSMFVNLTSENVLKDVLALANDKIHNTITIENGIYLVSAQKNADICLSVPGNTTLVLNGIIKLKPNAYPRYDIIRVIGNNVKIKGNGSIIGDKHGHLGETGEWGMGIRFHGANKSSVEELIIRDCWGDCIYVGGNSQNIVIEKCRLDHGRRQGISITKANEVIIRNCTIEHVSGTNPQYAIDVEPNRKDSVDNILIENAIIRDCEGGILVTSGRPKDDAKTPWIGNVTIRNCHVSCKSKRPVNIKQCEEVIIENCFLYVSKSRKAITVTETGKAIVQNNTVNIVGTILDRAKSMAKKLIGKGIDPIIVKTTFQGIVKNNKIAEQ